MAFIAYQHNAGDIPVMYLPASNLNYKAGMALVLNSDGQLVRATGDVKPEYISLFEGISAGTGETIPVEPVYPTTVYESILTGSITGLKVGSRHSINSAALYIYSVSTKGVIKILAVDKNEKGGKVLFTFVDPISEASAN